MPARMISAPTGGRPKVIGSSMAMLRAARCPATADQRADQHAEQQRPKFRAWGNAKPARDWKEIILAPLPQWLKEPGPQLIGI